MCPSGVSMKRTGVANLPLHPGKAPPWLFARMVKLSRGITEVLMLEYGPDEVLRRLSDPFWFQALSCVLGFDWHSSGCSTVTCGALKEALDPSLGIAITGGKGRASMKVPEEIGKLADHYNLSSSSRDRLRYCSRMAAKVDSAAVQDGHSLYHHVFLFTEHGSWAVIQQGMNAETKYARRYHWLSEDVECFVREPHNGIVGEDQLERALDMTAKQSGAAQKVSVDLVNDNPAHLLHDWAMLSKGMAQRSLDDWTSPASHSVAPQVLSMPRTVNWKKMREIYDVHPKNYEELLALKGVGPSTVRALALISELVYSEPPSWKDPIRFSFTVGGKDGVPFPVNRKAMDESTQIIQQGIEQARLGDTEKLRALQRLRTFLPST
jgi:uncharacterized protein